MSQTDASPVSELSSNQSQTVNPKKRSLKGSLICCFLGVIGGGFAALVMTRTINFFPVIEPPEAAGTQGIFTPEVRQLVLSAHLQADYRNMPFNAGLLGLAVTACLGLASGVLRRLPSVAVTGSVVGGLAGVILGVAGGALAVLVREQLQGWDLITYQGEPDPLKVQIHTMAIQFPVWFGTAAAVAITLAVSLRNRRLFAPILGAAVAGCLISSLLYPTAASILFSGNDPDLIIPEGFGNRLFWATLTAGLMGFVVGRHCDAGPDTNQGR